MFLTLEEIEAQLSKYRYINEWGRYVSTEQAFHEIEVVANKKGAQISFIPERLGQVSIYILPAVPAKIEEGDKSVPVGRVVVLYDSEHDISEAYVFKRIAKLAPMVYDIAVHAIDNLEKLVKTPEIRSLADVLKEG